MTNDDPASADERLQALQIRKLETEVAKNECELRRRELETQRPRLKWWERPALLAIVVPAAVTIAVSLAAFGKQVWERDVIALEAREEELTAELTRFSARILVLSREEKTLDRRSEELADEIRALEEQRANLSKTLAAERIHILISAFGFGGTINDPAVRGLLRTVGPEQTALLALVENAHNTNSDHRLAYVLWAVTGEKRWKEEILFDIRSISHHFPLCEVCECASLCPEQIAALMNPWSAVNQRHQLPRYELWSVVADAFQAKGADYFSIETEYVEALARAFTGTSVPTAKRPLKDSSDPMVEVFRHKDPDRYKATVGAMMYAFRHIAAGGFRSSYRLKDSKITLALSQLDPELLVVLASDQLATGSHWDYWRRPAVSFPFGVPSFSASSDEWDSWREANRDMVATAEHGTIDDWLRWRDGHLQTPHSPE